MQFLRVCCLLLLFSSLACRDEVIGEILNEEETGVSHPFLIVKESDYPDLRARTDHEPWKSMKEDAIARSRKNVQVDARDLQIYVGAAALSYILDQDNAEVYADKIRDAIVDRYSKLIVEEGSAWRGVVPNMGSFFMAIIALDIVYPSLTSNEIEACEKVIEQQIFKIKRKGSWQDVRYGTHGTWDIYKGIRTSPDDDYYEGIMRQITPDGVSPVTIHYAWERVGGGDSRLSKSGYMDVLEYTGIDRRYYDNERLKKFFRWLFGSSVNCSKEMAIIGDMLPTQGINNDLLHRRVVNFDDEAAAFVAWFHKDVHAKGHVLSYILPRKPLPDPAEPTSQLYENGGAFLRETGRGNDGLHLVLYNITSQDEWHTHQETNGLALSGLGNRMLVNGGRLGEPTRSAALNNTLTIDGRDHQSRLGGGLIDGFTTSRLDYASALSGPALVQASHCRNVILMHANSEIAPYAVIFDRVLVENGQEVVNYLHPANQSHVEEVKSGAIYQAPIDHYPTRDGTSLRVVYGTRPAQVIVEKVPSAVPDRYPGYPDHNRLAAHYTIPENGRLKLATVLIPQHHASDMVDIHSESRDTNYELLEIMHKPNIRDLVLCSHGEEAVSREGLMMLGDFFIIRQRGEQVTEIFSKGRRLLGESILGFVAENDVAIYISEVEGVISSVVKNELVISGDGAESITFDPSVEILARSAGLVKINLSPGIHKFSR